MRIVTVKFDSIYEWGEDNEDKKAKNDAKRQARIDLLAKIGVNLLFDHASTAQVALTETQYIDLLALGGEKPDVVAITETGNTIDGAMEKVSALVTRFEQMVDNGYAADTAIGKMIEVSTKFERFAETFGNAHFNEKVEVYTPGMGLMLFNRVMLLSDACSDAVQSEIDNGWRIIAACPQPDQRRPDYIMGRYERDDEPGAQRSALRK